MAGLNFRSRDERSLLDSLAEKLSPELQARYHEQVGPAEMPADEEQEISQEDAPAFGASTRDSFDLGGSAPRSELGQSHRVRALMTGLQSAANKFGSVGGDGGPKSTLGDTMERFNQADQADQAAAADAMLDDPIDALTRQTLLARLGPQASRLKLERLTYRMLQNSPILKAASTRTSASTSTSASKRYGYHSILDPETGEDALYALNINDPSDKQKVGTPARAVQTIDGPGGDRMQLYPDRKWRYMMGPNTGKTTEEAFGPGRGPTPSGKVPQGHRGLDTDPTQQSGETRDQAQARAGLAQARKKQEISNGVKEDGELLDATVAAQVSKEWVAQMHAMRKRAVLVGPIGGNLTKALNGLGMSSDKYAQALNIDTTGALTRYISLVTGAGMGVEEALRIGFEIPAVSDSESLFGAKLDHNINLAEKLRREKEMKKQMKEGLQGRGRTPAPVGALWTGASADAPLGSKMKHPKTGAIMIKTAKGWQGVRP